MAVESLETRQLLSGSSATLALTGAAVVDEHAPYAVTVAASSGVDLSTLSINWGDGTTSTGPAATSHVYDDGPADYAITASAQATATGGGTTPVQSVGPTGTGQAVLALPDGRVVVGGASPAGDFQLACYNADGSLDASFGSGGVVTTDLGGNDVVNALALETVRVYNADLTASHLEQRIVAAGDVNYSAFSSAVGVARYMLNGALDTGFNHDLIDDSGGTLVTQVNAGSRDHAASIAVSVPTATDDGEIYVGGSTTVGTRTTFLVDAFQAGGSAYDYFSGGQAFGTPDGATGAALNVIALLPDGTLIGAGNASIPAGNSAVVVRYAANGALNPNFLSLGLGQGTGLSVQPDGSAIVAGINGRGDTINLERITSDFTQDLTFGSNGVASVSPPGFGGGIGGLTVQADGSPVVSAAVPGATATDFGLYRFTPTGAPDPTFGTGGQQLYDFGHNDGASAVTIDAAGHLVAAGTTNNIQAGVQNFALVRFGGGSSTPTTVTSAPLAVHVNNVAPTPTIAAAPSTSPEGSPISLTGSATDPSAADTAAGLSLSWSVTKNGSPFATGSGAGFTFTPDDNGDYVVTLSATDKDGGTGTTTADVTVTDVAPTATIGGAPTTAVAEGSPVTLTASANDPSAVDAAAGFTYHWHVTAGNGTTVADATGAAFTFAPPDNGAYTVSLTATDKDGLTSAPATAQITATNVAPTLTVTGDTSGVRGQARHLTLTTTDPSAADLAAGFDYTINWGDGTTQTVHGGASLTVGHAYAFDGSYNVTATATDKDGGASNAVSRNMQILPWQLQGTKLAIGGLTADDFIIITEDGPNGAKVVKLRDDLLLTAGFSDAQVSEIDLYQVDDNGIVVAHSVTDPVYLVDANGNVVETIYGGK